MNIMFDDSINDEIRSKYLILELDTFYFSDLDKNRTAFCLVENTPLIEMVSLENYLNLHKNLMRNYRRRNWKFCEDALEHLVGKWGGDLDSFYREVARRIQQYKVNDPGDEWDGVIQHAPAAAIVDTTQSDS